MSLFKWQNSRVKRQNIFLRPLFYFLPLSFVSFDFPSLGKAFQMYHYVVN